MELVEIRKKLKKEQDKDRYEHTKGVMYTAGCLAMAYGYDMQKAMLCEENDILISSVERENPFLLHAKLGALLAKTEYDVTDPLILHAIKVHTTGEPDMNILDMIIYIADYIEPNRNKAANLDRVRELAFHDLDVCMAEILHDTLVYLKKRGGNIDPTTQMTYEFYKHYKETL